MFSSARRTIGTLVGVVALAVGLLALASPAFAAAPSASPSASVHHCSLSKPVSGEVKVTPVMKGRVKVSIVNDTMVFDYTVSGSGHYDCLKLHVNLRPSATPGGGLETTNLFLKITKDHASPAVAVIDLPSAVMVNGVCQHFFQGDVVDNGGMITTIKAAIPGGTCTKPSPTPTPSTTPSKTPSHTPTAKASLIPAAHVSTLPRTGANPAEDAFARQLTVGATLVIVFCALMLILLHRKPRGSHI
jgi:hypothetical protein